MAVYLDEEKCTGCGICVSNCPVQAIFLENELAVIDQDKCTECLRCMDECPSEAFYQVLDKDTPVPRREIPPSVQNDIYSLRPSQQTGNRIQKALSLGESIIKGFTSVVQYFSSNDTGASRRGMGPGEQGKGRGRGIQRRRRGGRK